MPDWAHGTAYGLHVRNSFPSFLKDAMAAVGLSQADLARHGGVSDSDVSRWLRGATTPSIEKLRAIAPALRLRLLDLVVAAGHLTPDEAGLEGPPPQPAPPVWSPEAIRDLVRTEFKDAEPLGDLVLRSFDLALEFRKHGLALVPKGSDVDPKTIYREEEEFIAIHLDHHRPTATRRDDKARATKAPRRQAARRRPKDQPEL